jgi:hypothetical protein
MGSFDEVPILTQSGLDCAPRFAENRLTPVSE